MKRHELRGMGGAMALAMVLSGCAGGLHLFRDSDSRQDYREERAREHVYAQPLAEVWSKGQTLMTKYGYVWTDDSAPDGETDWKYEGTTRWRYRMKAEPGKKDTCIFRFYKESESKKTKNVWIGTGIARDSAKEWALLSYADPTRAAEINTKAEDR